jgi:hypothetical protein
MTHFDGTAELDPTKHRAHFRLIDHLGAIVKAGRLASAGQTVPSAILSNKRPRGSSCPGYIEIQRTDVPPQLRWQCSWCEDAGLTQGFEGTIWDIRPRRASSESADGVVTVQALTARIRGGTPDPDSRTRLRAPGVSLPTRRGADRGLGN